MRILAIRGCNLASLAGEFEIDLAGGPLGEAGVFQLRVHVLLPGLGAELFAEQFSQGGQGLQALFIQGGELVLKLLLGVQAQLLLVAQLVQLNLACLLFLLLVLALVGTPQLLLDLLHARDRVGQRLARARALHHLGGMARAHVGKLDLAVRGRSRHREMH